MKPTPDQIKTAITDMDKWAKEEYPEALSAAKATAVSLASESASVTPHLMVWGREFDQDMLAEKSTLSIFAIYMPFNEDDEKRATLFDLGRQVNDLEIIPIAIFLITEAWLVEGKDAQPNVEPRHNPARKEVVIVFGRDLAGNHQSISSCAVIRAKGGMIELDGEFKECPRAEVILLKYFVKGFLARALGIASHDSTPTQFPA